MEMGLGNGFMGEYRNLNEQKGVCVVNASVGIIHNVPEGVSRLCEGPHIHVICI